MVLHGSMEQIFERVNSSNPLLVSVYREKETALSVLKSHPQVQTIAVKGDEIKLGFIGDKKDEAALLRQLIDSGVMISGFMREKGSLGTIFFGMTENEGEKGGGVA